MPDPMIALQGVAKHFGDTSAVAGATLTVERGEMLALLGPSGCGKTTLLRLVAGFERPDAGTLAIDGTLIAGPGTFVPPERRPRRDGVPGLRALPPPQRGRQRRLRPPARGPASARPHAPRARRPLRARRAVSARAVRRAAAARRPRARARPATERDPPRRAVVERRPPAPRGPAAGGRLGSPPARVTGILVTHDREEAFSIADRIALVRDGAIVQVGTPEELYYAPASRWAAEFVGAGTCCPARVADGLVETRARPLPRERRLARARRRGAWSGPSCSSCSPTPPARPRSSAASSGATTSPTACGSARRRARLPAAVERARSPRRPRLDPPPRRPRRRPPRLSPAAQGPFLRSRPW